MTPDIIRESLRKLQLPNPNSHKGQNGKLLLIGGSELFHAASKWSLDVAAHFVDMVFYSSVPSNNKLMSEAKGAFWNGIVISRDEVDAYAQEADCILIGPGMERNTETKNFIDNFVKKITDLDPKKRFVIDAGALQLIEPQLLTAATIITPHHQEIIRFAQLLDNNTAITQNSTLDLLQLQRISEVLSGATIVLKGQTDLIVAPNKQLSISGGTPGLTKGGTGDVLAGLIAALYCTNDAMTASVVGSYVNKRAAEFLAAQVGPFFSTTELATQIPRVLWQETLGSGNAESKNYLADKLTTTAVRP